MRRAGQVMTQVFLSHSTLDAEFALHLAVDLRAAGIPIWKAPESILDGEEWVPAIEHGLLTSTHFLLLQSPAATDSGWVKFEFNSALTLEKQGKMCIIPIDYQPCKLPLFWTQFQQVTSIHDNYEATLSHICALFEERQPAHPPKPASPTVTINATIEGSIDDLLVRTGDHVAYSGQPDQPPVTMVTNQPKSAQSRFDEEVGGSQDPWYAASVPVCRHPHGHPYSGAHDDGPPAVGELLTPDTPPKPASPPVCHQAAPG